MTHLPLIQEKSPSTQFLMPIPLSKGVINSMFTLMKLSLVSHALSNSSVITFVRLACWSSKGEPLTLICKCCWLSWSERKSQKLSYEAL